MDRSLKLGLWAGTFLCFATAASAVDGVIEINQAAAAAGGITPGDTPGFPVTLDRAGSYRLTGNLDVRGEPTPQNVSAIVALSDSITIDLNGFEIVGPAVCSGNPPATQITCMPFGTGAGILHQGNATITVRNGTVRGMGGIGMDLGSNALVEEVRATLNGDDGIRVQSDSIVTKCIASANADEGISFDGSGSVAVNNVANRNGGSGIAAGQDLTATGNSASENFGSGILVTIANGTIVGNSASKNKEFGLSASATTGYTNNVFNGNLVNVQGGFEMPPNVCGGDLTCP